MQKNSILGIIAIVLTLFVIAKLIIGQLCEPVPNNTVVNAVSNALSTPEPAKQITAPDPLSWEPLLRRLAAFVASQCPK